MKIKIKTKVVIRVLLVYWSCFFILWFLSKKLPEIREGKITSEKVQDTLIEK